MKKYICTNCGYILECKEMSDEYVCPMCSSSKDKFNVVDTESESLDSIIDSVIETKQ